MKFQEFMNMVAREAKKHKALIRKDNDISELGRTPTSLEIGGIRCQCCLTAYGEISAEETAIRIAFTLFP